MNNNCQDLDIKKEVWTEILFFLILFVIIGVAFLITKYNMNKAQHKIDKFEDLIIGTTNSGWARMESERYIVTFIDKEMLNYKRTDDNYYLSDNNELHFEPNTIYEDMTVPYKFKPTAMGKIVLTFEKHIYYVKFNLDGDVYIDFGSEPFSEQVDIVLKDVSRFINAFREKLPF